MGRVSIIALALLLVICGVSRAADSLPRIDFTSPDQVRLWHATHDVGPLEASPQGMVISIKGDDPYINGPALELPARPMWLTLRMKSSSDGPVEVFYYKDAPEPSRSVTAPVIAGDFADVRLAMPAMGPGWHIRIDPPGTSGHAVIASATFELREPFALPKWPAPVLTSIDDPKKGAASVTSGPIQLLHGGKAFGGFEVRVDGKPMAVGHAPVSIGYLQDGALRWMESSGNPKIEVNPGGNGFSESILLHDAQNVGWALRRSFSPGKMPGVIDVNVEVQVEQDRQAAFVPLLMLLPGAGSFGERKSQGLFAGLEYLDDEPSSSKADLIGQQSNRLVPDSLKITMPLMAIAANQRYLGLIWEPQREIAALFDSPDRQFASGGHAMGLLFPGSNGADRVEGSLLPERAVTISAKQPFTMRATIIGGAGASVVSAIEQYVALRGLPAIPATGMSLNDYARFAAGGWLDSKIREGDLFRHALAGDHFKPQPAADAAVWMRWLAAHTEDAPLKERLNTTADAALKQVPPTNMNFSGVSHIRYPVAALLSGDATIVEQNVAAAGDAARREMARFEPDGSLKYHQAPGHPDYGRTHFAPDANGLTAGVVATILQDAAFNGDPKLIGDALRLLRAIDKFDNTVPRGAQTWEVPLHTPDILASAYLVKAYVLGYELSGDHLLLDRAKYWAWTGVPFVYLRNPTDQPIGPYATIAVLGATNWEAPIWLGKPVQWCGLVYADAIARLAPHDPAGPWMQLCKGIAASGLQQSFPASDAQNQGLLPDSFELRPQHRNPPNINPGTLGAVGLRLYDQPGVYSFQRLEKFGAIIHAPGTITVDEDSADQARLTVHPWPEKSCSVLVTSFDRDVSISGGKAGPADARRRITISIEGAQQITLRHR